MGVQIEEFVEEEARAATVGITTWRNSVITGIGSHNTELHNIDWTTTVVAHLDDAGPTFVLRY